MASQIMIQPIRLFPLVQGNSTTYESVIGLVERKEL